MRWIVGFAHLGSFGEPDHIVGDSGNAVAFSWSCVGDALVRSFPVVVEAEPVQQLLEIIDLFGGALVLEPFLLGAVEPFQLAQGLGVIRRRVDHLHTEVLQTGFEHHLHPVGTTGEDQPIIRQHLPGQPITTDGKFEGVPRQLPSSGLTSDRGKQITGMIIQQVDHIRFGTVSQGHFGGVDLPQVVGDLPFKPPVRFRFPPLGGGNQTVAAQHLMDGRHHRRIYPGADHFRTDPAGTPAGMIPTHLHNLCLQIGGDLMCRHQRSPRSVLQTLQPLGQVSAPIPVVGLPGDPIAAAHLRHRHSSSLRLQQHL
jgi:hypothetical protein